MYDLITVEQCQRALLYLGYAQSLVNLDNLQKIIAAQREALSTLNNDNQKSSSSISSSTNTTNDNSSSSSSTSTCAQNPNNSAINSSSGGSVTGDLIDFNLFCVISAYLSVLQQEIHESGCISPIKGTNVPPPPVYLANLQGKFRKTKI